MGSAARFPEGGGGSPVTGMEKNYKFRITSIYQPTNSHIISHKTLLKHFKRLRHVSILSDHHQEALFLAKVMLQYSQFGWYLQTRCCGSISVHSYTIKCTVKTAM